MNLDRRLHTLNNFREGCKLARLDFTAHELLTETRTSRIYVRKDLSCIQKVMGFCKVLYSDGEDDNTTSPYRGEFSQCILQYILGEYVVKPRLTPHLCLLLGEPSIHMNEDDDEQNAKFIRYISFYMEHCGQGDILKVYKNWEQDSVRTPSDKFDEYFLLLLFQVGYTLASIYTIMPNFRHNDLKATNVFVDSLPPSSGTHTRYKVGSSHVFYVPTKLGICARIGDFDFSCASSIVDNYKVLEYAMTEPPLNIDHHQNHVADFGFFVKSMYWLCRRSLSKSLIDQLASLYSLEYLEANTTGPDGKEKMPNYGRAFPRDEKDMPSVWDVLLYSSIFSCYRTASKSSAITATYSTTTTVPVTIEWPSWALEYAEIYSRVTVPLVVIPQNISGPSVRSFTAHVARCADRTHTEAFGFEDAKQVTTRLALLFSKNHIYCPMERAAELSTHAIKCFYAIKAKLQPGISIADEFVFYYALSRAVYDLHIYKLRTNNVSSYTLVTEIMEDRCTLMQFLQMILQISWIA